MLLGFFLGTLLPATPRLAAAAIFVATIIVMIVGIIDGGIELFDKATLFEQTLIGTQEFSAAEIQTFGFCCSTQTLPQKSRSSSRSRSRPALAQASRRTSGSFLSTA